MARRSSADLFAWLMSLVGLQGIGDSAALTYQAVHGSITWTEVEAAMRATPSCPRLRCWWTFECGYRKTTHTCAEPQHIAACPLPTHDVRKGLLAEAAYALFLFLRDVATDLVGWIDDRLAAADRGSDPLARARRMRDAVLEPLVEVPGFGRKVGSMLLADLLLAGDPTRERWLTAGAAMVAVDTLVHAFLARTGLIERDGVPHAYGTLCYAPGGCADVIERAARNIDARRFDPAAPAFFPRFVQHAIWHFCAQGGFDRCNANRIDDRVGCRQRLCPAWRACPRLRLAG